jgi:hypothetical protein
VGQTGNVNVVVTASVVAADVGDRARALGTSMVILPRQCTGDGRGVYGEATLFLAKELRAEGVDVAYLDSSDSRLFEVKKSAVLTALDAIAIGVTSGVGTNAAWAGFKRLFHRREDSEHQIEISYVDLSEPGDRTQYTVRGRTRDVLDAIDEIRARTTDKTEPEERADEPSPPEQT